MQRGEAREGVGRTAGELIAAPAPTRGVRTPRPRYPTHPPAEAGRDEGGGGERVRLCWWGGGHKGGANDGAVAVPKSLVKKRARVAELLM
jgi:hypothetical protein